MTASSPTPSLPWRENPGHRRWLRAEADALFAFFEPNSIDPCRRLSLAGQFAGARWQG